MKTNYQKPNTKIVMLQHQAHILVVSTNQLIQGIDTNLTGDDIIKIGTYDDVSTPKNARSRSYDDWDDDEDF